jgi:polyhydroxyalkanoate synthase
VIEPQPGDDRFAHPAWQRPPYDLLAQAVLLGEEWWDNVVRSPGGISQPNQRMVAFCMRQWLDLMSPSNVPWLNPEVIQAVQTSGGGNLAAGLRNLPTKRQSTAARSPTVSRLERTSPQLRARSYFAMH